MKRCLSLLLAALMLTSILTGCNTAPAETPDTTDTAETTPAETTVPAETEPPVVEKKPYEKEIVTEYDNYTVTLSEPIVVFRGNEGDDAWGHTNFPGVRYTKEGGLRVSWAYGDDIVGAKHNVSYVKVSMNDGKTWLPLGMGNTLAPPTLKMKNGKYFSNFVSAGTPTSTQLAAEVAPGVTLSGGTGNGHMLYYAEDLAKHEIAQELNITGLSFREYDPETDTYTNVECTVNWPYAPVTLYPGGLFYTLSGYFALSGGNVIATEDGTLYTCIYCKGFDSTADSREASVTEAVKQGHSKVYVFESPDSGRTWNFLAQFFPGEEIVDMKAPGFEGYTEPKMIEMPDGSFVMLLRTGGQTSGTCPMYISRSTDGCRTWTTPEVFDYCGVLPQLLRLGNGVTIATYGRPDLLVRTTDDPSGIEWDEHIVVPLSYDHPNYMQRSCFYTSLLTIDENSAWFCYTDFKYPNKNGVPVKSVILRKITVTVNE